MEEGVCHALILGANWDRLLGSKSSGVAWAVPPLPGMSRSCAFLKSIGYRILWAPRVCLESAPTSVTS